jgi:hypothetical protein
MHQASHDEPPWPVYQRGYPRPETQNTRCDAQNVVYPLIMEAIGYLESII